MRVVFFVPHTNLAAGCRYRVHQFLPFLRQQGVVCDVHELVDADFYRLFYTPGHALKKALRLASAGVRRVAEIYGSDKYDAIFIHRECFPMGPPLFERVLARRGPPMLLDFDDAIYLPRAGFIRNLVRNPAKTNVIAQLVDHVVVANAHLAAFARAYNRHVTVIPTCVDTDDLFVPRSYATLLPPLNGRPVRLGWIGSHTTSRYLERIGRALARVAARYPIELLVVGAGRDVTIPGVTVINKRWALETEVDDFRSLDIGVYPLHDDLWELGKPGFKTIQYMAVGVPSVMSRAGSAEHVVDDGVDGFLATGEDEWVDKLCRLIEQPELRLAMSVSGREKAEREFSIRANAPRLLEAIRLTVERGRRS
jgi:glycosyltransferase involved in cell wall biosynthesis